MKKVILSCLTICAAIAVAEPALAHKRHGWRPHRHSHNHCHYHARRGYTHCHRHSHNGPGRGHHGSAWKHPIYNRLWFDHSFNLRY